MDLALTVPDTILHSLLDGVNLPRFAGVRYTQPTPDALADPAAAVRAAIREPAVQGTMRGGRVALAVGSRGIASLPEIVSATVAAVRTAGGDPFIVPSMGSHGGATAEGQEEVLRRLGVTEERVGAPVESCMETVVVGQTASGMPVHVDRLAASAAGIIPIARIKPHTAFRGPYESGMAKMLAIGLGKQIGAATTHAYGFGRMAVMVPAMARVVLDRCPVLFAVGILENACDQVFKLVAVPGDAIMTEEPGLLDEARAAMPSLPVQSMDVLLIDRIGKNISGDGADPNVTGRYPTPDASGGPQVTRQVVLDLTEETDGNANGLGTADFTTARCVQKVDLAHTYPNSITSTVPGPVKIPMILPSDRLALAAAILTCHAVERPPRILRIRDTLHVTEFWASEALLPELQEHPHVEIVTDLAPLPFDSAGNLTTLEVR